MTPKTTDAARSDGEARMAASVDDLALRLAEERDKAREECGYLRHMYEFSKEERDRGIRANMSLRARAEAAEVERDAARSLVASLEAENARLREHAESPCPWCDTQVRWRFVAFDAEGEHECGGTG